jgi:hypothetical protein
MTGLNNSVAQHSVQFGLNVSQNAMTQVTTIPMITVRAPTTGSNPCDLSKYLSVPDYYIENKLLIPKTKDVVYSRGIIVFFINRKNFTLEHNKLVNPEMIQFNSLPFTLSGYENLEKYPIMLDPINNIGGETFNFKSSVCVDVGEIQATPTSENKKATYIKGYTACVVSRRSNYVVQYSPLTTTGPLTLESGSMAHGNVSNDTTTILIFQKEQKV